MQWCCVAVAAAVAVARCGKWSLLARLSNHHALCHFLLSLTEEKNASFKVCALVPRDLSYALVDGVSIVVGSIVFVRTVGERRINSTHATSQARRLIAWLVMGWLESCRATGIDDDVIDVLPVGRSLLAR